ncbi:hypothetical protein CPLU01_08361 [Colletotrichum plurivorum]|uniref:GPI anchored protein n=1 Tax=Colletotrichum plurivorum TaxID=2175906 RepID=A0A8H6KBS8_9PEZI|nr:hypothetical protein CPLU01_08361 [Colletotrichum plurivorum]
MYINNIVASAILAFTGQAMAIEYVQHFGVTASVREPILTTITTDEGFPFSKTGTIATPVGESHLLCLLNTQQLTTSPVLQSEVCSVSTISVCEMIQLTSVIETTSATQTAPMTTAVVDTIVSTSVAEVTSTSALDTTSTSVETATQATQATPTPSSGGQKTEMDVFGVLAGVAAYMII